VFTTPRGSITSAWHSLRARKTRNIRSTPASTHDQKFALAQRFPAIAQLDFHLTRDLEKNLVRIRVAVPQKVAPQLHQLDLVLVQLGQHPRQPQVRDRP
jgi:hypothetical protein